MNRNLFSNPKSWPDHHVLSHGQHFQQRKQVMEMGFEVKVAVISSKTYTTQLLQYLLCAHIYNHIIFKESVSESCSSLFLQIQAILKKTLL